MDAAIDIVARGGVTNMGIKPRVGIHAHVPGIGVYRLAWKDPVRIPIPAGDHVIAVWASLVRNPHQALSHARVHVPSGQVVGLTWRNAETLFGSGALVAGPVGQPERYAEPSDKAPPGTLGKLRLEPPHPTEALVPLPGPAPSPPAPQPQWAASLDPAVPAGAWHPDPTGRCPLRWWDGSRWTDAVSDGTTTSSDPIADL